MQHRGFTAVRVMAESLIDARTDAQGAGPNNTTAIPPTCSPCRARYAHTIADCLHAAISPREQAAMLEVPTQERVRAYQLYLHAVALSNDHDNTTTDLQPVVQKHLGTSPPSYSA